MKDCWQQDPTKRPKATEIWRSTAQQMNEFSVKEESDVETTKHSDESSDTDSEDMEVSAMDDSGNASNYRSHAIGSDVVISVGVDTDRLNSLVGSSDRIHSLMGSSSHDAEALNHELPAMEGLDMETLTDELTTTDGFSIDMEVSSVEDSDGNTITPQVDELPEAACLIVGGSNKVKKIVETYDVNKKSFKPRKSTLYERWGSTSVKINNHVYTAGDVGSNFVECLNLNQVDGDWYEVASMKEQRCGAASAVLNDQMCVTGGCGGSNILSSVDLYNPVVNTWTNIAPMKTERCEHALVSYNGRLFAFGGVIGNPIGLESMESYDPREGKWKSLKPMNKKRSALCGVVYNDEIYAIGGIGLKSVERYNIRTNTWTNVSSLNHVRDRSCACVVNGKIYVIGGNGVDASRSIEAYDGTINEWKIETNMETSRHNASVVAL
uniref:kelch-like protein 12 n=1 Tax=Ciona intestinalis TaxID=7719 RepID=UPI000224AA40|nr:kelch-like protein 12 [Ciona intestinalis]|eukprot:XP_009859192.2 kelch-like protein 12 [Ciona intestinalis]